MTKYYYTDPLKAAWMAREFGVRYDVKFNGCTEFETINTFDFNQNPRIKEIDIFYISSDSEHIFEPKPSDFVMIEIVCDIKGEQEVIIKHEDIEAWDGKFIGIENRNNTAFFMPEMEET